MMCCFQDGFGPQDLGEAYRPMHQKDGNFGPDSYMDRAAEQQRVEEAESLDVNAGIHGNWTLENSKSKLHQFMQLHRIKEDYKYSGVGPDHNRYIFLLTHRPCNKRRIKVYKLKTSKDY